MTRMLVLVAMLATFACSALDPSGDANAPERRIVFTPDPVLEEVTRAWAERWSAATGLAIILGPGGTPVLENDSLSEEADLCGLDSATYRGGERIRDVIEVDRTTRSCIGWGYVLGHEMGHALGAEHVGDGIMRETLPPGRKYAIDAAALDSVCAKVACGAYNPEE